MGIFDIFKRKTEIDLEARRREHLMRNGRIVEGTVIDTESIENGGEIIFFHYDINGANFESSEILSADKLSDPLKYAPGAKVGVRFDPKNHGNSILV